MHSTVRGRGIARWGVAGALACGVAGALAIQPPAEELKYMSSKCASMLEAQRTASNTVRYLPSFQEMQQNYQRECGDNQSAARQRLYEDKRQLQQDKARENREQVVRQLQSENEVKLKSSQCLEMRSALEARKKRPNPTEGELRDIGLFEERYKARCQ
jgi:flagellar motility protein MotE (MotC chaperone)